MSEIIQEEKKRKKVLIIAIVAVLLLTSIVIGYIYNSQKKYTPPPPTPKVELTGTKDIAKESWIAQSATQIQAQKQEIEEVKKTLSALQDKEKGRAGSPGQFPPGSPPPLQGVQTSGFSQVSRSPSSDTPPIPSAPPSQNGGTYYPPPPPPSRTAGQQVRAGAPSEKVLSNLNASELSWLKVLQHYLPKRYQIKKAFILDSKGQLSEQIDIVIFDQQYSPFLFNQSGALYVPAESVYAVIEVKQDLAKEEIEYAGSKVASVRQLHRTSVPIPHAGGIYSPKEPFRILSGIVTLGSTWNPPFGKAFKSSIAGLSPTQQIDLGCALQFGSFEVTYSDNEKLMIETSQQEDSLIFFFLHLLSRLQQLGTAPMIDIDEYAKSLRKQ